MGRDCSPHCECKPGSKANVGAPVMNQKPPLLCECEHVDHFGEAVKLGRAHKYGAPCASIYISYPYNIRICLTCEKQGHGHTPKEG